jgi:transposase
MDAYSEDLRQKIVQAVQQRRMTKSEAARVFGVSRSSVKRYVKAVCEGRSLTPGKAPGKRPLRARLPAALFTRLQPHRAGLLQAQELPKSSVRP